MTSEARRRGDAGMTLIELVVTITVMGAILTVLTAAVTVTYRQQANTTSNLDIARWEQALALYMPTDLASADPTTLDSDPAAVPPGCTIPACSAGSNALVLSYDDGSGTTTVSYRYVPSTTGDGFELTRIECRAGACTQHTIIRDLAGPTDPSWQAGTDPVPAGVMNVSAPSSVDTASGTIDASARTVTISVNGLPDDDGVVRSSTVTVTAGGVQRSDLAPPQFAGPSFIEARSGCGGPVTLVVDDSGSVQTAGGYPAVRRGIESFVRAFEGTPTDLTVIRFSSSASALGTAGWTRSFDLSEPSEVTELVGDATPGVGGYLGNYGLGGGTDWKEALERTFLWSNGTPYRDLGDPTKPPEPELVVFFTDGVPTSDDGLGATPTAEYGGYAAIRASGGTQLDTINLRVWYRANKFLEQFRGGNTRIVGVGIGSSFQLGAADIPTWLPGWTTRPVPAREFLGDIVAGNETPPAYDGNSSYELVQYDATNGWGDVDTAHVLATQDMDQLGSGLAAIALAECGGTLTVQTRDSSGDPADADIAYAMGNEQVTTTRIVKAATFDVPFNGASSKTVELVPQSFDGTGYTPTGWSCSAGGVSLVQGTDWSLLTAGVPGDGISVTVTPNAAVSCTLEVA